VSPDVYTLPANLPVPEDDGAADHLTGLELPDLELDSSQGRANVRDLFPDLGVPVAGLSAQTIDDQLEFAERNRMPFPVIADPERKLGGALFLPAFEIGGLTLYKRLTLVAEGARIAKVFYPVFPPDRNAGDVLAYLRSR